MYNSTVPTPSAFSAFLDIHCILLQLECSPDVYGVLGLTWVMFFFVFPQLFEEVSKEPLAILPHVSFIFTEGVQVMTDVALHQIWIDARSFIDVNSIRQHFYHVHHYSGVGACFVQQIHEEKCLVWKLVIECIILFLLQFFLLFIYVVVHARPKLVVRLPLLLPSSLSCPTDSAFLLSPGFITRSSTALMISLVWLASMAVGLKSLACSS